MIIRIPEGEYCNYCGYRNESYTHCELYMWELGFDSDKCQLVKCQQCLDKEKVEVVYE
jgi:hypothetical protein